MLARSPTHRDLHAELTYQLLAVIEVNPGEPELPWRRNGLLELPRNAVTGDSYNDINIIALWLAAARRGISTSLWATYRQ